MEFGFSDYNSSSLGIEQINDLNKEKLNIAIVHGTVDGSDKANMIYNPMSSKKLIEAGFDYIALGHIHKRSTDENNKIVYPGSMISFGFDELGEHGMIIGNISKEKNEIQFIKLDNRIFMEREMDISEINSQEELIEKINELNFEINTENKIILIGKRKFEINKNNILKLIQNNSIIKIKNNTKINYNLEKIASENNLRGIFVKKALEKIASGCYEKDEVLKAIEIGLEVL